MPQLKNPVFIKNITDPITGNMVKTIYHVKMTKMNRLNEQLVWEYYRNRANMSIQEIYDKFKGKGLNKLKIIYFNDPKIYEVEINL